MSLNETFLHNRRVVRLENDQIRVSVTVEGGHIAEILDKATGVNPMWLPPWPTIEISQWSPETHPEYGNDSESKLLAGIMGHNLCLDMFGPPSEEEARAGMVAHAEAGIVRWEFTADGSVRDLRVYPEAASSSSFTTHLMDPKAENAWFVAWSPESNVALGYVWSRADFPWLGIWEENCNRPHAPWLGRTKTRGMEFGVSPFPETRRQMLERGTMSGEAGYRWIPAGGRLTALYYAAITPAAAIPESLEAFEALL